MSKSFEFTHLQSAVSELSTQIRKQDFLTYFKKFSLITVTTDTVTLGVVSSFHRDNLSKKFYTDIKNAVQKIAPHIEAIDIIVDDMIENRPTDTVIDCRESLKESEKTTRKQQVE